MCRVFLISMHRAEQAGETGADACSALEEEVKGQIKGTFSQRVRVMLLGKQIERVMFEARSESVSNKRLYYPEADASPRCNI